MPFRKVNLWGNVKPPAGFGVDWGDPINKGLVVSQLYHSRFGGDLAQNKAYPWSASSNLSVVATRDGVGVKNAASSNRQIIAAKTASGDTTAWSIRWRFECGSLATIQCLSRNESTSKSFYIKTTGKLDFYTGSAFNGETGTALVAGNFYDIIITRAAGQVTNQVVNIYSNGVLNSANYLCSATSFNNIDLSTGYWSDAFSQTMVGKVSVLQLWNRALSQVEISRLYSEPFAGIQTPRRRVSSQAAVGGGGFIASSAYQNGQIIGVEVF